MVIKNQIITCAMIDKLGKVFEYYDVYNNCGVTFEEYYKKWLNGIDVTKFHERLNDDCKN